MAPVLSQEEIEKKKQDRIAHGKRLKELADKRRAEKVYFNVTLILFILLIILFF